MSERPIRKFGKPRKPSSNIPNIISSGNPPRGSVLPPAGDPGFKDEINFRGLLYNSEMVNSDPNGARSVATTYKEALPSMRDEYRGRKNDFTNAYKVDKLKYGAPTIETLELGNTVVEIENRITETEVFVDALIEWLERMN